MSCYLLLSLAIRSSHRRLSTVAKRDPGKDVYCACPNQQTGVHGSLFHRAVPGAGGALGRRGEGAPRERARVQAADLLSGREPASQPCRLHRDVGGEQCGWIESQSSPRTARRWLSPPRDFFLGENGKAQLMDLLDVVHRRRIDLSTPVKWETRVPVVGDVTCVWRVGEVGTEEGCWRQSWSLAKFLLSSCEAGWRQSVGSSLPRRGAFIAHV